MFFYLSALAFTVGTVSLHLTDAHGKPVPSHEVWLTPTNSAKSLRTFGDLWWIPRGPKGKTDAAGNVKIAGVSMMVVTRFGPRFDSYVHSKSPDHPPVDVMKLDGAVYAGKPAHVVLADDYRITGRIVDLDSGSPLAGVKVFLEDTMAGHMSGYPLTDIDETKTDANGMYEFRRLPNCSFTVRAVPSDASQAIESRAGSADWTLEELSDENGKPTLYGTASLHLNAPVAKCNFRASRAASLSVTIKKGSLASMRGWTIWPEITQGNHRKSLTGQILDWSPSGAKPASPATQDTANWTMAPGNYAISFERKSDGKKFEAIAFTLHSGEKRKLELTLSDALRRTTSDHR